MAARLSIHRKIENYPGIKEISGFEYAKNLYEQAKDLGAEIRFEQVTAIETAESGKLVKTTKDSYECRSVILATGAKNRPLSLPREQELIGAGVSYCATCDGMFFRGRDVAVVGGGNTALEDAAFLANYCSKVYIIHPEIRIPWGREACAVPETKEKCRICPGQ